MKVKLPVFFLLLFSSYFALADNQAITLREPDSLFAANKPQLALKAYRKVYFGAHKYSEQMLYRMAKIAENNGTYQEALLYLNTIYLHYPSRGVAKYMAEMAAAHNLKGYFYSDLDFLSTTLFQYQKELIAALILSGLLILGIMAYYKFTYKRLIYFPTLFVLFCLASAIVLNLGTYNRKAIVTAPSCYVFKGDGAAAPIEGKLERGDRVTIISQNDIWYRIITEDHSGYVNIKNLMLPI